MRWVCLFHFLMLFAAINLFSSNPLLALTWDEPWHETVIEKADAFVAASIIEADEKKGFRAVILQRLAGKATPDTVTVDGFYLLRIYSRSGNQVPKFYFKKGQGIVYLFLKQNQETQTYQIATPTTGYAYTRNDTVAATYRISMHQAIVLREDYELTMTAIFKHAHGETYDRLPVRAFCKKWLSYPPARTDSGLTAGIMDLFYLQHVALETCYHLADTVLKDLILPFLYHPDLHAQTSAVRALSRCDTPEMRKIIVQFIMDNSKGTNFGRIIALKQLKKMNCQDQKETIIQYANQASKEKVGFGLNIMDSRIATHLPSSLSDAIEEFLDR